MTTHSSILAWRIQWTEEPGGLWSVGSQGVGHDWSNWVPTQREEMTFPRSHSQEAGEARRGPGSVAADLGLLSLGHLASFRPACSSLGEAFPWKTRQQKTECLRLWGSLDLASRPELEPGQKRPGSGSSRSSGLSVQRFPGGASAREDPGGMGGAGCWGVGWEESLPSLPPKRALAAWWGSWAMESQQSLWMGFRPCPESYASSGLYT